MDNALDTRQLPSIPVISRKRFADLVGVSEDTVSGWINRGYLPAFKMGKYRLVNLAMLNKQALERSQSRGIVQLIGNTTLNADGSVDVCL